MRTLHIVLTLFCLILWGPLLRAQSNVLENWTFEKTDDMKGWSFNHLAETEVKQGFLHVRASGKDPFLVTPPLVLKASRWQAVEIRAKSDTAGRGDLYFTNTNEGKYGGFSNEKSVRWTVVGDGQWHDYRIYPFWEKEGTIIKFRIDFPNLMAEAVGKTHFEIASVRVVALENKESGNISTDWDFRENDLAMNASEGAAVEKTPEGWITTQDVSGGGWLMSDLFRVPADDAGFWVSLEMRPLSPKTGKGKLRFATDTGGFVEVPFELGDQSVYNVDMTKRKEWSGNIRMLGLSISDEPNAKALVRRLQIGENPQGPASIRIDRENLGLSNASNRAGTPLPFALHATNTGGTAVKARLALELPAGLTMVKEGAATLKNELVVFPPNMRVKREIILEAARPVRGTARVVLSDSETGKLLAQGETPLVVGPSLNLPKASYVPEPKPVKTAYDIGALYYPGWEYRRAWDRIEPVAPIRKPMLGWYDEANVECIDWQIKWMAENGIGTLYVDWYWNLGRRHHEHWIDGFKKARHRKYLKYAIMWANHNKAESHTYEDQAAVTTFWCEHLFGDPQYERIDGKPVVWIWSARLMDEGIALLEAGKGNTLRPGEGVKRLLDLSQKIAKEHGYKGIYFIVMKFPEGTTAKEDIQWYADCGFDRTSIYHFMEHGGKATDSRHYDFQLVAEASLPWWRERQKTGILPFMPNISSGWDDRPWNNGRVIYGRTPELFRKICEDCKVFCEETGIKKIVLSPLNEWGEGSYIEPNREFGFSMYEQVRETFCEKPAEGWPLNYAPADVGLGPYDLPETVVEERTAWDFQSGTQGWGGLMNVSVPKAEGKRLVFRTLDRDPAVKTDVERIDARQFDKLVVRMKQIPAPTRGDFAQLFWTTVTAPMSESASAKASLQTDGDVHEYLFDLSKNPRWKGRITSLRFDPINKSGIDVEIESIRLVK